MTIMELEMERQTKSFNIPLEVKEVSAEGNVGKFTGLGSVFGNIDQGGDVVEKGAFKKSLKTRMPVMLWQHDMKQPIGVFVEAKETSEGLLLEGEINLDTQKGKEAYSLIKQGAISGLSIGYFIKDYEDRKGIRYLKEVDLFEVSVVTFPMNQLANVTQVKSIDTIRDFEQVMRDIGFSRQEAKTIAAHGYNALQRDAEATVDDLRDADVSEAALKKLQELGDKVNAFVKSKSK